MKRSWKEIKWIFKQDGALRDIYVHEVVLNNWEKVIDIINEKYTVDYGVTGKYNESKKIDKNYVIECLLDQTGKKESKSASISLGKVKLNCHFCCEDQIEFDIDPKQINSIEDFELIENFMIEISKSIDNQVTLSYENIPKIPLVKIDSNRGINKLLTKEDVEGYFGQP